MTNIIELNTNDIDVVSGGSNGAPAPSIVDQLRERFPFGEFRDGSFWPNGYPEQPWTGPVTW